MVNLTRRRFTQGIIGSGALGLSAPNRAFSNTTPRLVAEEGMARLAPLDYPETAIWGYHGRVPGPPIRVKQGERVTRDFVNRLPQASSVHWHGIRLENAMDGVPGLTQDAVPSGEAFTYDFLAPDAGTYWYHPHNRTWEQMARGLYGALIVEEREGAPAVDIDEVLLIDDWRLTDDAQIAGGFGNLHDMAHGGRIGNWITVNGLGDWNRTVMHAARLRLRLINTANARIMTLGTQGLDGWVVALDGMPLDEPQSLEWVVLGPSQRADVIVDVTAEAGSEALLISQERDGGFVIAAFPVAGSARAARLEVPQALPANPMPRLGPLEGARHATLRMEGGAMGNIRSARVDGRTMEMREMAQIGKVWAFNGMVGMGEAPLLSVERGETVRVTMVNDTAWPHAMHLHGHHFRQVLQEGGVGPLRDTLLMARGETAEIALVADNPGDWLLHCHMLEHADSGMMTWMRVD